MLFSNEVVAQYINENFEPTWESVRPVPQVTIDFGNGKVIRRTLHGNVATYACAADGRVLDVLPGIYEPRTYVARLKELQDLYRYARQGRFCDSFFVLGAIGEVHPRVLVLNVQDESTG